MMCRKNGQWFRLLACISLPGLPATTFADATDIANYPRQTESSIEIEYFNVGNSKSNTGNAQIGASGIVIQTEYEKNDMVFSFNYERWSYNWKNPESLPFVSGTSGAPWDTFNTLQFGFAYEQELNDRWELNYYAEVESSFEKEISGSNEYETGVDFIYEPSDSWSYTLNLNLEYLDASELELGVDFEVAWNHDKKEGWSGELEIGSEFPETSLTYHFNKALSTTMFYNEGGTNTIRLADSTPVVGFQNGRNIYLEEEYNAIGLKLDYEFADESYVTFALEQITNRRLSFTDGTEAELSYDFADTIGTSVGLIYTF